MGEIKSAWELAMERVEKLGKVSTEELRHQDEEKRNTIGQVLADKYLGGLALWQLQVEFDKFAPVEQVLIRAIVISRLIDAIELGNYERLERVREAVVSLRPEPEKAEAVLHEMAQLFDVFATAKDKETRSVEASARGLLHQLRISGSAISGTNPRVVPEWRSTLDRLARPYIERLDALKGQLKDLS